MGLGILKLPGLVLVGAGVAWAGSTGAIASNRLVITPTLGAELLTDGGFENWTSDTDLTSWTESITGTTTVNKEASVIHGGTYALRCDIDASNSYAYVTQAVLNTSTWYKAAGWVRTSNGTATVSLAIGDTSLIPITPTTSYALYTTTRRATNTKFGVIRNGAASSSIYFDDASVKPLTLSSCFQVVQLPTKDVEFTVKFTMIAGLQVGIVFGIGADYNNLGLLYHDGAGNVKLEIFESGTTWTTKSTTAIAYGADAAMTFRRDDREIWVYYGATPTLCGTGPTTTLSESENNNLSGLKIGLFSTSELCSFSSAMAHYVGSNGELDILNRILGGG